MGFTVTPLAQKARTATLIADSDLNLGNYDLIATDVRGDTAEFSEFVGGVGNFSNVLGSGNLDIEGTGNIKGLTTFQNAVQVNGALHVEGSINNVNIADNGEITTAQGVNGADFNGAKITSTKFNGATINTSGDYSGRKGTFSGAVTGASFNNVVLKTGVLTVTPTSGTFNIPSHTESSSGELSHGNLTVLSLQPNTTYSGNLKFRNSNTADRVLIYWNNTQNQGYRVILPANSDYTLTFNNIKYLIVTTTDTGGTVTMYNFTIS